MSFILDALRKSETERQQQGNAEFAGVPSGSGAKAVPRWLLVVGVLLSINLAVLIGLLMRPDAPRVPASIPVGAIDQAAIDEAATSESTFAGKVALARLNTPERQPETEQSQSGDPVTQARPLVISRDPIETTDIHPTIHEVRAGGTSDLPELHLDIHVYSDIPEDRFVFINMSKHREGSQLDEGPVVAEITPDGVVLGHRGTLFVLPRE